MTLLKTKYLNLGSSERMTSGQFTSSELNNEISVIYQLSMRIMSHPSPIELRHYRCHQYAILLFKTQFLLQKQNVPKAYVLGLVNMSYNPEE